MVVEARSYWVDGVQVWQVPSDDEVCSARLVFGVGTRDEPLHEQGVMHALEHVVMSQLRHTPLEVNAHVDQSHTEFAVAGDPAMVGNYLTRLCRNLSLAPSADQLSKEAPVIAAELEQDEWDAQPLLVRRYGFRDLGSHAAAGPGPDGLHIDQLAAAAARWFTAGNAFLLIDGRLPPDLTLPLRQGARPSHLRVLPRPVDGPAALLVDAPVCMASMLLPPTDPAYLSEVAVELIEHRAQETVRHRDSLAYVVQVDVLDDVAHPAGPGGHDVLVSVEPPEKHLINAVTVLITELRNLLRHGPSETELALAVERIVHRRRGRASALGQAHSGGIDALLGFQRPPFDADRTRATTMKEMSDYLKPLEASLLFALPEGLEINLTDVGLRKESVAPTPGDVLPEGRRFRPHLFDRATDPAARKAELCLTPGGLHTRLEGEIQSIRWADVVGILVRDEHEAAVFSADGSAIEIGNSIWRDGDTLIRAAHDHVPPHLFYSHATTPKSYCDH